MKVRTARSLKTKAPYHRGKVLILSFRVAARNDLNAHPTHFFELLIQQFKLLLAKFITTWMGDHRLATRPVNPAHRLFEGGPLYMDMACLIVTQKIGRASCRESVEIKEGPGA